MWPTQLTFLLVLMCIYFLLRFDFWVFLSSMSKLIKTSMVDQLYYFLYPRIKLMLLISHSYLQGFHHRHIHQGLDPLIRSISKITTALSNVSSVFQLFSYLVVCSNMISKKFGFVEFFASVETSSVCNTYTGCFTTLGHNCRRWFPRSLWWKKFI